MKKLWGRVGVTLEVTDEQYEELLRAYASDEALLHGTSKSEEVLVKLLTDKSVTKLDGETYFPEAGAFGVRAGNDNPEFEMNFDF